MRMAKFCPQPTVFLVIFDSFTRAKWIPPKLKRSPNDEKSTMVLLKNEHKRFTGPIKMPKILKPLDLDQDRRKYLNKKISSLVFDPKNKNYYALEELSLR